MRRVCTQCAEPYVPTANELRRLAVGPQDLRGATFMRGKGCPACRFTGYRGRIAVFELLVLNELVKDAILNRRTSYEIRRISVETSGLVALIEDGLYKASYGLTSIQELLRHLPRVVKPRPVDEIRRLLGSLS
jgi:type IV pilus assembly protein PilB